MDDYESQTDRLKYMVSHSPISVTQHHRQIDDPHANKNFHMERRTQAMHDQNKWIGKEHVKLTLKIQYALE